ncbi:ABC transporter ATP-binding protein [Alicyclobacillus dauci]|uniref:ABC transporter ATP-binding protein n=1 Tax=Alicyclobacillus dauci TaxID=1475485 RepID=A0ABY6YXW6_9BACL|nr:ABC transporter ATP-binding protein [Alicyclobacillus dauci]WAH35460.1 ABC transporter ATP-binding protein [Alicyclobacillus dauci]
MSSIVEIKHVSKEIDGRSVLSGVDLAISAGSVYGIVGANGAGKTTLLRLLNGVYRPSSGEIHIFGQPMPEEAAAIRQRVHLVSSDGSFYPGFRVKDLFRYASMLYSSWDHQRCNTLIAALELPVEQSIRTLSLGMQMQLRLAVALCSRPDILLLDEPTNGLDPVVRRQFLQLIVQEVAGTGMTVVMATHRFEDLEAIADGISVLYQGRLLLSGMLEDLKTQFHEVIAVADGSISADVWNFPGIQSMQSRGAIHSCIVKGDTTRLCEQLESAGVLHIDILPLSLEELFRAVMRKEGYSRDAVFLL